MQQIGPAGQQTSKTTPDQQDNSKPANKQNNNTGNQNDTPVHSPRLSYYMQACPVIQRFR